VSHVRLIVSYMLSPLIFWGVLRNTFLALQEFVPDGDLKIVEHCPLRARDIPRHYD